MKMAECGMLPRALIRCAPMYDISLLFGKDKIACSIVFFHSCTFPRTKYNPCIPPILSDIKVGICLSLDIGIITADMLLELQ